MGKEKEIIKLVSLKALEEKLKFSPKALEKPLFVVFKWEKCGVCHVNVPMIEELLVQRFPNQTENVWVDVDAEDIWEEDQKNPKWQVTVAPTYHLYDKNRKLVFKHSNFLAPPILENEILKTQK